MSIECLGLLNFQTKCNYLGDTHDLYTCCSVTSHIMERVQDGRIDPGICFCGKYDTRQVSESILATSHMLMVATGKTWEYRLASISFRSHDKVSGLQNNGNKQADST